MKNYILDFDGTLLHLQADWVAIRALVRQAVEGAGASYDPSRSLDANLFTLRVLHEKLFLETIEKISALESERLNECPVNRTLVLKLKGAQYAIFTSNSRLTARAAFAAGPLATLKPEMIVGKEDVDYPKPHPNGVQVILKKLGWDKKNVAYIGDSRSDEESATAAGVPFVLVNPF